MRTRVHYFLFESIAFEKDGFLVLSWRCLIRYFKKQISAAKLLFSIVLSLPDTQEAGAAVTPRSGELVQIVCVCAACHTQAHD
jgi:hypothetical protein